MTLTERLSALFGDPETALNASRVELQQVCLLAQSGDYLLPPIPFENLALLRSVNPHLSPLPEFVASWVIRHLDYDPETSVIKRSDLKKMLIDLETMANGFLRCRRNKAGQVISLHYQPSINVRRCATDTDRYGSLHPRTGAFELFDAGEVIHLLQHESSQQMYGKPYWIGNMQSTLLGEDTRIFPRLFFRNGGSTGDIIATAGLNPTEQISVDETVKETRGRGRFKRMIFQFARGKIDEMIKVIPYSTGSDRIDFSKLAQLSSDDVLDSWGIRRELVGMTPDNPGGSGDMEKLERMFHKAWCIPRQQALQDALEDVLPRGKNLKFLSYDEANVVKLLPQ